MKHMSGSSTMNNNSKLTSPTFSFIKTANPLLFLHVQSMSIGGGGGGERENPTHAISQKKKKNPSRVSIIFSCISVFLFVFA